MSIVKKSIQQIRKGKGRVNHAKIASLTDADRERFRREDGVDDRYLGPARFVVPTIEVSTLRERLGLSQDEFAERYFLPKRTIQEWEQHRREPSEPARVLLFAISRDPDSIARALRSSTKR